VDGVEAASFFFGEAHGFDGHHLEARIVNARQNFALLCGSDCVGLDDCECAFGSQLKNPPMDLEIFAAFGQAQTEVRVAKNSTWTKVCASKKPG
jgi:hypothetical protein